MIYESCIYADIHRIIYVLKKLKNHSLHRISTLFLSFSGLFFRIFGDEAKRWKALSRWHEKTGKTALRMMKKAREGSWIVFYFQTTTRWFIILRFQIPGSWINFFLSVWKMFVILQRFSREKKRFFLVRENTRRGGWVAETNSLLNCRTRLGYRGFESPLLRQKTPRKASF